MTLNESGSLYHKKSLPSAGKLDSSLMVAGRVVVGKLMEKAQELSFEHEKSGIPVACIL